MNFLVSCNRSHNPKYIIEDFFRKKLNDIGINVAVCLITYHIKKIRDNPYFLHF